ncbi:MAG: hypothetical protein AAFV88_18415 [Planctomycetota bacterium]
MNTTQKTTDPSLTRLNWRRRSLGNGLRSRGYLPFEVVVGLVFLTLVTLLVVRSQSAWLDFESLASDRLRRQLQLENTAAKLESVPYPEVESFVSEWNSDPKYQITLALDAFETNERSGLHVTLTSKPRELLAKNRPITWHVWRWEAASNE